VDGASASGGRSDVGGTGSGGAEAGGTGSGARTGGGGESATVPSHQILTIDEADIENASGDQLLDLAGVIGDARGYAMCDCYSTKNPGEFTQEGLEACAEAETGLLTLSGQESEQRCVRDLSRELPGFDDFLRCQLQVLRLQAIEYLECSDGPFGIGTDSLPCQDEDPMGADALLTISCRGAFYCDDGVLQKNVRCDGYGNCPSLDDERDCRSVSIANYVRCGDSLELVRGIDLCIDSSCAEAQEAGFCGDGASLSSGSFLCSDGSWLDPVRICDGASDCASGEDELIDVNGLECLN
jgi:hypothetical protein